MSHETQQPIKPPPDRPAADDAPPMPATPPGAAPGPHSAKADADSPVTLEAPPVSFGRQMAQLVIIPAVIVIVSIGIVAVLGSLVRSPDTVEHLLIRLQGTSGIGRTAVGLNDPRYQDRCRAAQDLATRIPHLTDPAERQRISEALIEILNQPVEPDQNVELRTYLLLAIGLLGEEGGLGVLTDHLDSPQSKIVEGAVGGILVWHDMEAARQAVPDLVRVLQQAEDPILRAEAAAALGKLARQHDQLAIEALAKSLQTTGNAERDVRWNAGVALAKLSDERGVRMVTSVLLNREALAKLPADTTGPQATQMLSPAGQDRVMAHTLANVMSSDDQTTTINMKDPAIWDKIAELAEKDSSRAIRKMAQALLDKRGGGVE